MDQHEREGWVLQVKVWSFLVAMAVCAIVHGSVPGWPTVFAIAFVLLWAFYGYKRLFGGWPDAVTFRESGRAFMLALGWPLLYATSH